MLPLANGSDFGGNMQNPFESWIGQRVVVQLALGQVKVSLRGVLLEDLTETLLMKPEAGPRIEIAKTKILAIEREESKRIPGYWLNAT